MKKVTLGGDRLGTGSQRKVETRTFERSTHDLGYTWRSTMAPGTLVPFMVELGLPGDTFDIDLQSVAYTNPTLGPLFGSYKAQFDVFQVPIRLYQAKLHNNKLGIGLEMDKMFLPQIWLKARNIKTTDITNGEDIDNWQINPSHILSYLGIRGLGRRNDAVAKPNDQYFVDRKFDATPYIAYYDIVKNYYANKQEGIGYIIDAPISTFEKLFITNLADPWVKEYEDTNTVVTWNLETTTPTKVYISCENDTPDNKKIALAMKIVVQVPEGLDEQLLTTWLGNKTITYEAAQKRYAIETKRTWSNMKVLGWKNDFLNEADQTPQVFKFNLNMIDDLREEILADIKYNGAFQIATDATEVPELYRRNIDYLVSGTNPNKKMKSKLNNTMQGLALKTYQSDIFNNWLNNEFVTVGAGSINILSRMLIDKPVGDTNSYLYVDEFILKSKVYEMLNDIAVSGGSYNDWINAVYDHEGNINSEIPIYCGGLSKEIVFEEVISKASVEGEPLGSLAGRGTYAGKHKGGKIHIRINEPSYIIGIVSLTPRIDYSQGNRFYTDLKTMDDLHKPHLDQIGFQDLITDKMHYADTQITSDISAGDYKITKNSAGKIPAWSDYMTNFNRTYGNFAIKTNQMFMTLNRRYEIDANGIKDLTTYVDPSKYNYIFADARLDAQNFWMQIGVDMIKRSKMSAKVMPNIR